MPVQFAWKTIKNASSAVAATNKETPFFLSEADFPLLDSKPEVDEYKANKGRRNAKTELLKKQFEGKGLILKQVVGQGQRAKAIGKKRRARLLSENSEDMVLNVPYSLNRKKLWELESSADCLKESRSDENVQLSAIDQHLTGKPLSPFKEGLAFHQVNEEGIVVSQKCQSERGFAELNVAINEEKPLNIRYVMAKAHSSGRGLLAGYTEKAKHLPRSTKRAQLDTSVYSTDAEEATEDEAGLLSPNTVEEIQMYTHRPRIYTLGDFVRKDKSTACKTQKSRHVPLDSFVQVEMPNVQESVDTKSVLSNPMSKIGKTNSLMKKIDVPAENLGIVSRDDWFRQCTSLVESPELRFQWLNLTKGSFQIDATPLVITSKTPHIVLTIAYETQNSRVRLLINRSQECQYNWQTIDEIFAKPLGSLNEAIQTVTKNSKIALKIREQSSAHSSEFNSTELSTTVTPLDNYSLLYGIKQGEHTPLETTEIDEEEEDDFEKIDMDPFVDSDQVLENKWTDSILDEQVAQMKTLCEECGENDTTKILLLDQCGHSFCSRCLKTSLYQQICENSPILRCPFNYCASEVPATFLQSIFELPVVAMTIHSCAESKAQKLGQQLFSCTNGCGIGVLETPNNKLGQVQCNACKNHFCIDCHRHPHWPLTCAQNKVWSRKRDLQSKKLQEDGNEDSSKNEISQQFWSVCNEARKRRIETQTSRKVTKEVLKRVGYKCERQFSELRKACLQVVENGYAWLYLSRNNRPSNWVSVKTQLTLLYKMLNNFETTLTTRSSEADKVDDNMQKLRITLRKTISEIRSV